MKKREIPNLIQFRIELVESGPDRVPTNVVYLNGDRPQFVWCYQSTIFSIREDGELIRHFLTGLSHDGSEDDLRIEDWTPDPIKVVIQDADEFNQWYRNHVVPNTSITGIGIEGVVALFNQYLELNLGKKI